MGTHIVMPSPAPALTTGAAHRAKAAQLKQAAQEFEGMLLSELWKGFENDPLTGSNDSDDAGGSLQGLGLQQMSTALSASGGVGLASMIERQLAPDLNPPSAGSSQMKPLNAAAAALNPLDPAAATAARLKPLKSPPLAADNRMESDTAGPRPVGIAAQPGGRP